MKSNIHPKYYKEAKITCACGNSFTSGATLPEIRVEVCSACHPFFTGKQKFIDTQGRIDRFKAKIEAAKTTAFDKNAKKEKQQARRSKGPKLDLSQDLLKSNQKSQS